MIAGSSLSRRISRLNSSLPDRVGDVDCEMGNLDPSERPFDRRAISAGRGIGSNQHRGKGWRGSAGEDQALDGEVDLGSEPAGEAGTA